MRRIVWLLGLLAIVVVGTVWWSSRNAIRLEPLDGQRFAQMSETEQVEWLIEQISSAFKTHGYTGKDYGEYTVHTEFTLYSSPISKGY
jgi:hypothetical protein